MLIALNKPFGVLCQFTDPDGRATLANHVEVPGVYPAGRLDHDSEGLLLLSDDGPLIAQISNPRFKWPKTYLVQVEGEPDEIALRSLRRGVQLKDGPTLPSEVERLDAGPDWIWPRIPPIRERRHIPTSWLRLTLREGRNRQVRRMTAAVGFPTLRLVRERIGDHALDGLAPGQWRWLDQRPALTPEAPQRKAFVRRR